jgi:hypothetical protein
MSFPLKSAADFRCFPLFFAVFLNFWRTDTFSTKNSGKQQVSAENSGAKPHERPSETGDSWEGLDCRLQQYNYGLFQIASNSSREIAT